MNEFKIGDVVQLKSGGPLMTIENFDEDNKACCVWFIDNKQQYGLFEIKTIKVNQ